MQLQIGGITMNKTQLIECVALEANLTKKVAGEAVDAVFAVLTKALKEGAGVKVAGFGNFIVKERKERKGRNPLTKEEITIPATTVITFKPSKTLKEND
jgi:DNA-binding protein HU-beta